MSIITLLMVITPLKASCEDIKGLQPFQPFGVFSTFSSDSLSKGDLGLGLNLERSKGPDFYRTTFQAAYGVRKNLELHLNLPYFLRYENDIYGFEDISIGYKHRLVEEEDILPSIAYLLMFSPGLGRSDFSTDGRIGGGLVLTKKVGPFKGHANLIFYKPFKSGLTREYLLNLGLELAVTNRSKILGELVGRKDYQINRIDLLEWRIGYRQETIENVFTTIGAGFDIKDRRPDYRFMFSLNFIIPTEKREIKKIYED